MSETVQYGLIGKQDIKRGFSTFQVKLADGQVVTMDELDIAYLTSDAYTEANLPTTGTGRLARVTDGAKGLWMLGANGTWYALNGECVNVNDFATLAAAISDISTTTRTLLISDSVTVSANLTIPANVTCWFTNQGAISVSAAVTLSFNGLIVAPRRQIFSGSGTVDFGDGSTGTVYPEWFGAVVDGSTDDTSKVQTAVDACSTSFGGVVEISPNTLWTSGSVTIPSNVLVMDYSDPDAPVWRTSATTRSMMENLDGQSFILNGTLTVSMAANAVTVALKTKAGSDPSSADPVKIAFRHATITNGTYVVRSVTSATSVVIPSGATLGTADSVAHTIQIGALDNAGTVELYVAQSNHNLLLESSLLSTTAISTSADSAEVAYSTSARSSVAHRVLGYFESTQTTAGTWAAAASKVQLYGGGVLPVQPANITAGTATATTSGTAHNYTNIPSGIRRITVIFNEVSLSGTAELLVQIGDSGGIENTSYVSTSNVYTQANTTAGTSSTAGFIIRSAAAANVTSGRMTMEHVGSNLWIASGVFKNDATVLATMAGSKTLSAELDRVRITTSNGTDTFDAGSVNIVYER